MSLLIRISTVCLVNLSSFPYLKYETNTILIHNMAGTFRNNLFYNTSKIRNKLTYNTFCVSLLYEMSKKLYLLCMNTKVFHAEIICSFTYMSYLDQCTAKITFNAHFLISNQHKSNKHCISSLLWPSIRKVMVRNKTFYSTQKIHFCYNHRDYGSPEFRKNPSYFTNSLQSV